MYDTPWSEHDKNVYDHLRGMRLQVLSIINEIDFLTLKIQQKYELPEQQKVIKSGRY